MCGFDNCAASGQKNLPIETLGMLFGQFLASIPGPEVDVVAHSMGGLIVRAYMAGLQTSTISTPPQNTKIRKIVFIATPHFGAVAANFLGGQVTDNQVAEDGGAVRSSTVWRDGTRESTICAVPTVFQLWAVPASRAPTMA